MIASVNGRRCIVIRALSRMKGIVVVARDDYTIKQDVEVYTKNECSKPVIRASGSVFAATNQLDSLRTNVNTLRGLHEKSLNVVNVGINRKVFRAPPVGI